MWPKKTHLNQVDWFLGTSTVPHSERSHNLQCQLSTTTIAAATQKKRTTAQPHSLTHNTLRSHRAASIVLSREQQSQDKTGSSVAHSLFKRLKTNGLPFDTPVPIPMAEPTSPHLTNIPQAIRFASDTTVDPGLKQQAIDYLRQVTEACDETWQVRIPLVTRDATRLLSRWCGTRKTPFFLPEGFERRARPHPRLFSPLLLLSQWRCDQSCTRQRSRASAPAISVQVFSRSSLTLSGLSSSLSPGSWCSQGGSDGQGWQGEA